MKKYSSIPALLWYAPVITGWCYMIVCVLLALLNQGSPYKPLGDLIWNLGLVFIVISMVLLHKLNLNGTSTWRKITLFIPVAGCVSYQIGAMTGWFGEPVLIFFPISAFLTAIGMLMIGIQVIKAKELTDWKRFTPLMVGLYPFAVMFPILFITGHPNIYAILLWGLPWKIMGCALLMEYYKVKRVMA